MEQKIINKLKEIEKLRDIKILFAIESGSRSWQIASKDSDYDVRFVFYRPLKDYLRVDPRGEVIDISFDKDMNSVEPKGALVDMEGFDIFKYSKMLMVSNPTVIEWLLSDIIYYGEKPKIFLDMAKNHYNPIALYHHYKSMCKQNYLKYLKSGNLVTYKKYLYAYRGLINAMWVKEKKSLPPIIFPATLIQMQDHIPEHIFDKLVNIILKKKEGKEKDIVQNIKQMDNYIESFLKQQDEVIPRKRNNLLNELNEYIFSVITMGQ